MARFLANQLERVNHEVFRDACCHDDIDYAFAKKVTPLSNHTVLNFSLEGGRISYNVETPSSRIRVEGTISDTNFSVVRSSQSKSGKMSPVPLTLTLTGKRTGNCEGK